MNTASRTSGLAVASLVFGVLSWCALPVLGAILAIVLGHAARNEIRRALPGTVDGDGMALVGLVLGWAHMILIVLAIGVIFLFFGGLAFFAQHWF